MFCSRHAGDADDGQYVETDPTGRYGRFEAVLGKGAMKIVYPLVSFSCRCTKQKQFSISCNKIVFVWALDSQCTRYRAFDVLEGMEVAWNQARIRDVLRSPEALERLYSEVHLLSTLQHDSIIQFLASWVDGEKGTFNFITEMFTSGTLREYRQRHKRVNMRAVKNWARQILHGLVYLHNHKPPVIHRDLKCDNIFINGHLGQVKIGDLGLAAILRGSQQAHSIIGTPEFMAPEMYDEEYNELVDVYSFGMCMLEIITGEHPYNECSNPAQIYKKVTSGKLPGAFHRLQDPEAKRFVGMCLEKALWRPSARDLLLDPFLADEEEAGLPGFQGGLLHGGSLENRSIVRSKRVLEQEKSVNGDMKITGKLNPDDDTIFLRVQISDNHGHPRNIYFPFDILHDTPASVAHEMVGELDIEGPGTWQITEMINQEISALVPGWKDQADHYHNQHAYSYQEDDDHSGHHPVHYTSSSPSSRESRDFSSHNWLQDTYPDDDDDATSETSINSGKYSSISCSDDCKQECKTISPMQDVVASPQSQRSKLRIEESSRIERRNEQPLRVRNNKQCSVALEPPPTSNRIEKNSPRHHKFSRNKSYVDLRSQMLHQKLVEEVNKRMYKTIGSVENIGFQSPYNAPREGKEPSNFRGIPMKNSGFTWGSS